MTTLDRRLKPRKDAADVLSASQALAKKLTAIEEVLHQTKARSTQDLLNYPMRLNNRLASLAGGVSVGDHRPTDQALAAHQAKGQDVHVFTDEAKASGGTFFLPVAAVIQGL